MKSLSTGSQRMTGNLALSPKHAIFVEHYCRHPKEPHKAAIAAGVPEAKAKRTASSWLRTPHIVAAIQHEAEIILARSAGPAAQTLADLLHSPSAYARLEAAKDILNRTQQGSGANNSVKVNINIGVAAPTQPTVHEQAHAPVIDGVSGE